MDINEKIALRQKEEALLCYPKFANEDALALGLKMVELAKEWGVAVAIDIEVNGVQLFHYNMPGSNKRHCMWVRRKQNTVQVCQASSLHAGQQLELLGKELWRDWRLDEKDYAVIGGGFPICVAGTGIIGAVACSGLPHEDDHRLIVTAISEILGVDLNA